MKNKKVKKCIEGIICIALCVFSVAYLALILYVVQCERNTNREIYDSAIQYAKEGNYKSAYEKILEAHIHGIDK